ncbi:MAG: hypothetical protein ACI9JN_001613 [Bacteroidia bacterium]|jgi:hypothetical protein
MKKPDFTLLNSSDDIEPLSNNDNVIMCEIDRKHIESENISWVMDKLLPLSDRRDLFYSLKDRVVFIVSGYDNDPRELYEVEQVRSYFTLLADNWPFFLHYLSEEFGTLGLFMAATSIQANPIKRGNSQTESYITFSQANIENLVTRSMELAKLHGEPDMVLYEAYLTTRIANIFE